MTTEGGFVFPPDQSVGVEMPKYSCHKTVHALKIKKILLDSELAQLVGNRETDGSAIISPGASRENAMWPGPRACVMINGSPANTRFHPEASGMVVMLTCGSFHSRM